MSRYCFNTCDLENWIIMKTLFTRNGYELSEPCADIRALQTSDGVVLDVRKLQHSGDDVGVPSPYHITIPIHDLFDLVVPIRHHTRGSGYHPIAHTMGGKASVVITKHGRYYYVIVSVMQDNGQMMISTHTLSDVIFMALWRAIGTLPLIEEEWRKDGAYGEWG